MESRQYKWKILNKGIRGIVIPLILCTALTGCGNPVEQEEYKSNYDRNKERRDSEIKEIEESNKEMTLEDRIRILTNGCTRMNEGEMCECEDYSYQVNKVRLTNKVEDWFDRAPLDCKDELYVVVNIDLIPKKKVIDFGQFWLTRCKDSMGIWDIELNEAKLIYDKYEKGNKGIIKKDACCEVEKDVKLNTDLMFAIDYEDVKNGDHYLLTSNREGLTWAGADPEIIKTVFLQSMEGLDYEKYISK